MAQIVYGPLADRYGRKPVLAAVQGVGATASRVGVDYLPHALAAPIRGRSGLDVDLA